MDEQKASVNRLSSVVSLVSKTLKTTVKQETTMKFQVSFAVFAMIVCFAAATEEAKSAAKPAAAADRSKRGLYAPLITSPYAPAYTAPYAAPYAAPYVAPYAAPYVAAPYVAAPYTSSYVSSYTAYPYGYASPYGFF